MMIETIEDNHLDVLQNIEVGLKTEYEKYPDLTDLLCINALENAIIAIKKEFGFAKKQYVSTTEETQGIMTWIVEVGHQRINDADSLTLKEYIQCIEKIKRSVKKPF